MIKNIKIVLLIIISCISLTISLVSPLSSTNFGLDDNNKDKSIPFMIKTANNDTSAPVITFINPDNNDTIIRSNNFDIIANITDSNPPLPGNVSIEILNVTNSLFNASMTMINDDEWLFTWNNITSYPNQETYILKVTAKDSSENKNIGTSSNIEVYIDIYYSPSPGILNIIIFIILTFLILMGIMFYINKRRPVS
ncbi:MAG: hypothetical protein ACFFA0_01645 [Promethearchaeota archaeon]